jgi:predicted  nucleic acid-binding Zn-ribbon protein
MKIEVSNGEIADKLTIIEIKKEKITDKTKLVNLEKEYRELNEAIEKVIDKKHPLYLELYEINEQLWDIEDHIRDLERKKEFSKDFIETSRSVYITNDKRSEIKRKINELTGSALTEEKSYKAY